MPPSLAQEPGPRVIGLGLTRTGTNTLQAALERLGFGPCYHDYSAVREDRRRNLLWLALAKGRKVDIAQVFGPYRSAAQIPIVKEWKLVVDRCPQAQFILTVRDPDRWYQSSQSTIFRAVDDWSFRFLARIHPLLAKQRELMLEHELPYIRMSPEAAKRFFVERNEQIIREVPADRLLVFQASDGWRPLCEFLGVEVPDEPFPHVLDRDSFQNVIKRLRTIGTLVIAGAAGVTAAAVLWLLR